METNKLKKDAFVKAIKTVHDATSVTGVRYTGIHVEGSYCIGTRESTKKDFRIDIDNLYRAYSELEVINTSTLKKYIDRVQSPSYAILKKAGLA